MRAGADQPGAMQTPALGADPDHHPLVATRALLEGRAARLPGPHAERPPSGRMPRFALDAMLQVAEALFSSHGEAPAPERMRWLAGELDDFMARTSTMGRLQLALAGLVVSVLAPLAVRRPPGLGRLSLAARVRALGRLEQTAAAPPLVALRAILCLIYYEHPDAVREAGIDAGGPAPPADDPERR